MLICMQDTSVRIDRESHAELKRLSAKLDTSLRDTVKLAIRALRQQEMGRELSAPLRDDEREWLGADLG